jgi:hypothetical protein
MGEGGEGWGAKSYDGDKAWSSISHSILSAEAPLWTLYAELHAMEITEKSPPYNGVTPINSKNIQQPKTIKEIKIKMFIFLFYNSNIIIGG